MSPVRRPKRRIWLGATYTSFSPGRKLSLRINPKPSGMTSRIPLAVRPLSSSDGNFSSEALPSVCSLAGRSAGRSVTFSVCGLASLAGRSVTFSVCCRCSALCSFAGRSLFSALCPSAFCGFAGLFLRSFLFAVAANEGSFIPRSTGFGSTSFPASLSFSSSSSISSTNSAFFSPLMRFMPRDFAIALSSASASDSYFSLIKCTSFYLSSL